MAWEYWFPEVWYKDYGTYDILPTLFYNKKDFDKQMLDDWSDIFLFRFS